MLKKRLIACLLWRDGLIVQSVSFKHTNFIGDAFTAVDFFNTWAIDEIIILDVSRDDKKRNLYYQNIQEISHRCFVPLAVGGKIHSVDQIREFLKLGADKVVINTEAVKNPNFITEAARSFGSQCIVVSIDVNKDYKVCIENGGVATEWSPFDWAKKAEELGAGEIFLTSIERDGSRNGYDLELIKGVAERINIPVIASGGVGNWQHLVEGINIGKADAVSAANIFHYSDQSTKKAKNYLKEAGIKVREPEFYKIILPRRPKYRVTI
ncbi:MAG: imidazole glycerol phosphate synthase cyclase subunit [Candidatus Nealsonbacteria bacterium]